MKKEIFIYGRTFLLFAILFVACKNKQTSNQAIYTLEVFVPELSNEFIHVEEIDFSEISDSLTFIVLETTEESLISNIDRIYYTSDFIYILDGRQNKLFQFNIDGRFINQIASVGKGPGEYSRIFDFTLNLINQNIILLCEYKLIEVNSNGELVKEIKLNEIFHSLLNTNNSLWLFSYNDNYCATLVDYTTGETILNKKLGKQPETRNIIHLHRNVTYGSTQYFVNYWDNTIYTFSENAVIPYYYINFGKKSVSKGLMKSYRALDNNDFINFLHKNNYMYNISNFIEGNEFAFFRTEPSIFVLYDKITSNVIATNAFKDKSTELNLSNFVESASSQANYLTNVIQPSILLLSKEYLSIYSPNKQLLKIIESVKEEDNPLLVRYHLK